MLMAVFIAAFVGLSAISGWLENHGRPRLAKACQLAVITISALLVGHGIGLLLAKATG